MPFRHLTNLVKLRSQMLHWVAGLVAVAVTLVIIHRHHSPVNELARMSEDMTLIFYDTEDVQNRLTIDDLPEARRYINSHPDHTSYFLLLGLKERFLTEYNSIPEGTRASVLCDRLTRTGTMNERYYRMLWVNS